MVRSASRQHHRERESAERQQPDDALFGADRQQEAVRVFGAQRPRDGIDARRQLREGIRPLTEDRLRLEFPPSLRPVVGAQVIGFDPSSVIVSARATITETNGICTGDTVETTASSTPAPATQASKRRICGMRTASTTTPATAPARHRVTTT